MPTNPLDSDRNGWSATSAPTTCAANGPLGVYVSEEISAVVAGSTVASLGPPLVAPPPPELSIVAS